MTLESKIKKSKTDVLIIGAGPSGLMAALWLARTGTPFRIIDKRGDDLFHGQADGLESEQLSIFKSFSHNLLNIQCLDTAWKKSNHIVEVCFWSPGENGVLERKTRKADTIPGIARYQQVVLHQSYIEDYFLNSIGEFSSGKSKVERPLLPLNIDLDESKVDDPDAYPVKVLVKNLSKAYAEGDGKTEQFGSKVPNGLYRQFDGDQEQFYKDLKNGENVDIEDLELIECKYVLGSDGAHSWVRKQLGIEMEGESTDYVWGVVDMVPITDFPDIRNRCAIHSLDAGSVMVIPREKGLVRLYIQLKEVDRDPNTKSNSEFVGTKDSTAEKKGRIDRSKITPEMILKNAQEIFKPYKLEMTDLDWFTGYQIGQRVAKDFSRYNRIFISGDACHTHSPKAGQGMNVSMADTYNLGWKLALVSKNLASREILSTYTTERQAVANNLIEFDHKLSRMFSGKPMIPNSGENGIDMKEFEEVFTKGKVFASGTNVDYQSSVLVQKPKSDSRNTYYSEYAKNMPIGKRIRTTKVVYQSDARPEELEDKTLSDGRFRVLVFSGDVKANPQNFETLESIQKYLDGKDSFVKKYTPKNANEDSVFEIITIHSSNRKELELTDFPEFCRPRDYKKRMDYWKLFAGVEDTYHEGRVDAYNFYGIDNNKGAIVVLRPDGYISNVYGFNAKSFEEIGKFFDGFMIDQGTNVLQEKDISCDDSDRFLKPLLAI